MKRPAVFFDRDNTLIACDDFLGDPDKVVLVEGAAEAVAKARQLGFVVVTFSNQSGVARGFFTEEAVQAVNQRLDELLQKAKPAAIIARHEFCPFHPQAPVEKYRQDSPLRKPNPGMILQSAEALKLDLSRSWVIGDAPRDIAAGKAAGLRTILFTHPSLKRSQAADENLDIQPDFTATSLPEAVEIIGREVFKKLSQRRSEKSASVGSAAPTAPSSPSPIVVGEEKAEGFNPKTEDSGGASPHLLASNDPDAASTSEPTAPSDLDAESPATVEPSDVAAELEDPLLPRVDSILQSALTENSTHYEDESTPKRRSARSIPSLPTQQLGTQSSTTRHSRLSTQDSGLRTQASRTDDLLQQILEELKRRRESPSDFSISKLLAGITQILALAALFIAFLHREGDNPHFLHFAAFALILQTLTIALLIMSRQR